MDSEIKETLISEGIIKFKELKEGNTTIKFDTDISVNWYLYNIFTSDSEKNKLIAYIDYDFGMPDSFSLDYENNMLLWGYDGLTKESSVEDKIKSNIKFDIFHALCHYEGDPNYAHKHWALCLAYENKCKITYDQ